MVQNQKLKTVRELYEQFVKVTMFELRFHTLSHILMTPAEKSGGFTVYDIIIHPKCLLSYRPCYRTAGRK